MKRVTYSLRQFASLHVSATSRSTWASPRVFPCHRRGPAPVESVHLRRGFERRRAAARGPSQRSGERNVGVSHLPSGSGHGRPAFSASQTHRHVGLRGPSASARSRRGPSSAAQKPSGARGRRALRPRREVRGGGGASASPGRAPRRPAPRLPRNSAPCRSLTATSPAPGSGPTGPRSAQTRVSLLDMLALPSQDIRKPGTPPKGSLGHNYLGF